MNYNIILLLAILVLILTLPTTWVIAEIKNWNKPARRISGILAILCCFCVAYAAAQIVRLNYNIWYSAATAKLLDSTIAKLEQGQTEIVIQKLKDLRSKIPITYERKGNYDELVMESLK
jgi:hypothetical protein